MNATRAGLWIDQLPERVRWGLHLVILSCPIFLSMDFAAPEHRSEYPQSIFYLAGLISIGFLIWGLVFAGAFRISGITAHELHVETRPPLGAIGLGFVWFFVTRILLAILVWIELKWIDPKWLWATEEKVSSTMAAHDIAPHPVFSLVVYGLAALITGLVEELWRAGMLTGLEGLFPQLKGRGLGALVRIAAVSLIFAVGHLYQGWFGMENALLLGVFLGFIIVYRNSYWEAAIAHAITDASAFGAIVLIALNPHILSIQIVSAASQGDLPKVQHLIEMGGNINDSFDWKGITPLEEAARRPDSEMLRFLLLNGANPNVKDFNGQTPLITAAKQNQVENMKLLISKGADLNGQDEKGYTALREAVQLNRMAAAGLMIDKGADMNLADKDGVTPLEAAQKLEYLDMVGLLQQKSGK